MTISVLVTDGDERSSLAVVRSLGRSGFRVHVAARRQRSLAGMSRAAAAHVVVPDALTQPDELITAIAAYVAAHDIRVVVPVTDASALALIGAAERLSPAVIPMPDLATFRLVSDKAALARQAAAAGLAVPPQREARDAADARAAAATLRFPLVLKPARSVAEAADGTRVKLSVRHAADPAQLDEQLRRLPPAAYPLLLQQRIVGPGVGVFLLMWDGERVATFTHRRLREKPPSGGVSVLAESTRADPELVDRATCVFAALGWRGVAMLELKVDAATGVPYVMEVNGRFWGSLQLAIDSGVDFPTLLVRRALGLSVRGLDSYRVGQRGRWWWGDVDHVVTRLMHRDAALAVPPGTPGRARMIADFVAATVRGAPDQVFRLRDPVPFLLETARWVRER